MNSVKDSILRADLLGASTSLRVRGQPFYESIFGGVVSILTILFFFIIIVLTIGDAFDLKLIKYREDQGTSLDQLGQAIEQTLFSIKFPLLTRAEIEEHFEVKLKIIDFAPANLTRRMLTQTHSHSQVGPAVGDSFDFEAYSQDWFGYGTWNTQADLSSKDLRDFKYFEGSYSFEEEPLVRITTLDFVDCPLDWYSKDGIEDLTIDPQIEKCPPIQPSLINNLHANSKLKVEVNCKNTTGARSCSVSTRNFLLEKLDNERTLPSVTFMVKDTIFSPKTEVETLSYVKKINKLEFDVLARIVINMELSSYQTETDSSFMPWEDIQSKEGYYVSDTSRFKMYSLISEELVAVFLEKSQTEFVIEREYGKFDDIISYFGGLFGLLFILVTFLIGAYNEIRYELLISNEFFRTTGEDSEEKFSVLTYAQYMVYDWLCFFNLQPRSWHRLRKISESRDESNHILDVVNMQRRIIYLENCIEAVLDENQRLCIHFIEKPQIEEITFKRKLQQKITKFVKEQMQQQVEAVDIESVSQLSSSSQQAGESQSPQTIERRQKAVKALFESAQTESHCKVASRSGRASLMSSLGGLMKKKSLEQENSEVSEEELGVGIDKQMDVRICQAIENLVVNKASDKVCEVIHRKLVQSKPSQEGPSEQELRSDTIELVPNTLHNLTRKNIEAKLEKAQEERAAHASAASLRDSCKGDSVASSKKIKNQVSSHKSKRLLEIRICDSVSENESDYKGA